MPRPISVISAAPPGFNPGMESVDLGFDAFAERHGIAHLVRYYRLYRLREESAGASQSAKLRYDALPDMEQLLGESAAVVYWGDFFHMWQYQCAVARLLSARGIATSFDDGLRRVRRAFLLECIPASSLAKVVSFGSTLLFNTLEDEQRPHYGLALKRFVRHSHALWFRDVYSGLKASHLSGDYSDTHLCVDCATLLPVLRRTGDAASTSLGVFFGRSHSNFDAMVAFAEDLARRLGLVVSWQPWGDQTAFPALRAAQQSPAVRALPNFTPDTPPDGLQALTELTRHRCVVTDTYHMCVNAWAQGLPAVCIAQDTARLERSVNSGPRVAAKDKRYTFFAMYDALDFLLTDSELLDPELRSERIDHVARMVDGEAAAAGVTERIRLHASASADRLWGALRPLLSA